MEAFRRLHASDRIVRGRRIVNYCSALRSVISDIEVESHAVDGPQKLQVPGFGQVPVGRLHLFAYRLEPQTSSGEQEEIVVATTRLETMLGDTAIAVHPSDSRYGHLIGRRVLHPFLPERRLPIVADDTVDPDTGTGAVKVTPAHSEPDLLIGQRHNLDVINILNDDGSLNASVGEQFQVSQSWLIQLCRSIHLRACCHGKGIKNQSASALCFVIVRCGEEILLIVIPKASEIETRPVNENYKLC